MITTKKLLQVGDSLGIVIDTPIRKKLKLEKGDLVQVEVKKV
jgi:CTP-dependent riboflavin kinase